MKEQSEVPVNNYEPHWVTDVVKHYRIGEAPFACEKCVFDQGTHADFCPKKITLENSIFLLAKQGNGESTEEWAKRCGIIVNFDPGGPAELKISHGDANQMRGGPGG